MLKRDLMEMQALGGNGQLPIHVLQEAPWSVTADRGPNLRLLSDSDVEALRKALDDVGDLSFAELVERTHAEPAYVAANGGRMRYEDLLDPSDPDRARKAAYLAEAAPHAIF